MLLINFAMNKISFTIVSFCFSICFVFLNNNLTKASLNSADIVIELNELKDLDTNSKVIINGIIAGDVNFVANQDNKKIVGLNLEKKSLNSLNYSTIAIIKSPMTVDPENRSTSIELITPDEISGEIPNKIKGFCSFEEFWTADLGPKSSYYEL